MRALKTTFTSSMASLGAYLKGAVADQALRCPLLLPLALVGGAAAYMAAPDEPGWPLLAASAVIPSLLSPSVRRHWAGFPAPAIAFIACFGVGAVTGNIRTNPVAAPILKEQIVPVRVEGVIVETDAGRSAARRTVPRQPTLKLVSSKQSELVLDPCQSMGHGGAAIESQGGALSCPRRQRAQSSAGATALHACAEPAQAA
ncbi:MAG: hypothetical protein ABMA14_03555 [Hyphomonadaceae bacterium]